MSDQQDKEVGSISSKAKMKQKLGIKPNVHSISDEGKHCRQCGLVLAGDADLCIHCGCEQTTGKRLRTKTAWPLWKLVWTCVLIMLTGAAAWGITQAIRKAHQFKIDLAGDIAETREKEILQKTALLQNQIEQGLNQKAPLFKAGENVELRRSNGTLIRGLFQACDAMQVSLLEDGGAAVQIPLQQLDRASQLRCSEEIRALLIQQELAKRTKKMTVASPGEILTELLKQKIAPVTNLFPRSISL